MQTLFVGLFEVSPGKLILVLAMLELTRVCPRLMSPSGPPIVSRV